LDSTKKIKQDSLIGLITMLNPDERDLKHPVETQKQVDRAQSCLKDLYFDLGLSSFIYSECSFAIDRYYSNNPDSSIKVKTLVGCIVYLVSTKFNEHLSIATIAGKVGVSTSWLSKKKKKIESILSK
jgi:hypothetical protein